MLAPGWKFEFGAVEALIAVSEADRRSQMNSAHITVPQLQQLCSNLGIRLDGLKPELLNRIATLTADDVRESINSPEGRAGRARGQRRDPQHASDCLPGITALEPVQSVVDPMQTNDAWMSSPGLPSGIPPLPGQGSSGPQSDAWKAYGLSTPVSRRSATTHSGMTPVVK